jgi:hypothetical protein
VDILTSLPEPKSNTSLLLQPEANLQPMQEVEVWKPIPGFSENYLASSLGRIKSIGRYVKCRAGFRLIKDKILRDYNSPGFYKVISFGPRKTRFVHRLVSQAFHENPENKRCVNHIDGNKLNNRADNLEWATFSENELHSFRVLGKKPTPYWRGKTGKEFPCSIPMGYYENNVLIRTFDSLKEVGRYFKVNPSTVSRKYKNGQTHKGLDIRKQLV